MKEITLHDEVKHDIAAAYIALLAIKPSEEISVTELAKKAGVSRMSFYRNFSSKSAIIDYKLNTALAAIYSGAHFMDMSIRQPLLLEEFRYAYDNSAFLKLLEERGYLSILFKWWDYYAQQFLLEHDPKASPYEYAFYSGASINVIICWIETGLKESPEQMAKYFDSLIADRSKRGEEKAAKQH